MSLTTQARKLHPKVEIGSRYFGPPLDRPCIRSWPGLVLHEEKEPSALWPIVGIVIGVLFGCLIVAQLVPK